MENPAPLQVDFPCPQAINLFHFASENTQRQRLAALGAAGEDRRGHESGKWGDKNKPEAADERLHELRRDER